jgi:methylated-DNA-[protein]-cysteine S-methyltransferase
MTFYFDTYHSPIGILLLQATDKALITLEFRAFYFDEVNPNEITEQAKYQLDLYFKRELVVFSVPLEPKGTEFQLLVWAAIQTLPFGKIITYSDQSKKMNNPKAIRAIASANGQNPIPIIIPCHRIIGSNGHLTGYSGGIDKKEWLLKFEGSLLL